MAQTIHLFPNEMGEAVKRSHFEVVQQHGTLFKERHQFHRHFLPSFRNLQASLGQVPNLGMVNFDDFFVSVGQSLAKVINGQHN